MKEVILFEGITFFFYISYLYIRKLFPMPKIINYRYLLFITTFIFVLTSCDTTKTASKSDLYDPVQVADLSKKLGIKLQNTNKEDDRNMPLYAESSLWLGVKYKTGGLTKKGIDCSGLTFNLYQKVYRRKIPRNTSDLSRMKMQSVSKNELKTGDLVFFATSKNHNNINHVGIYLKDGCFVHASTSRGVIVSHLDEGYYSQTWKKGGRVR